MFPTLNGELGSVTNHFRFDHLAPTAEKTVLCMDIELKTPLQNTNQFIIADEEDDERTLSTDWATNQTQTQTQIQSKSTIDHSEGIVSMATKVLEDVINRSPPKHWAEPHFEFTKATLTRGTHSNLQKQTSFHGSETAPSISTLRHGSNMAMSDSISRFPRRNFEYSRLMSVDQRSISDTEDSVAIESDYMKGKNNKTQSCADIKLSCTAPRSPGTIVVKEKYIELPKQMARAISSSTDHESDAWKNSTSLISSTESMARLSNTIKPRFTTIKVDESQLGKMNERR